ncbi:MAG: response regulator [Deltaproteobacteria bacterium]|nr:response regulator [Deltaproteobacteria bacterium]
MDTPSTTARVMIVDDEPDNLRLLEKILNKAGHKALVFRSGESALKAADISPPDIVLLDIDMPLMNGFQACARFRAQKSTSQTPILFISALTETFNKVKAFEAGGLDYIVKPFQAEEVLARVNTHIELQQQRRQTSELLRKTLVGAIKAFNELVGVSFPGAQRRTIRVSQDLRKLAEAFSMENLHQLELAAMLANLGTIVSVTTSPVPAGKAVSEGGDGLSAEGLADAARVISHIPQLGEIAAIVERIADGSPADPVWQRWPKEVLAGQILRVVMAYETRLEQNSSEAESIEELRRAPDRYFPAIVKELARVEGVRDVAEEPVVTGVPEPPAEVRDVEWISLEELRPGLVLADNLMGDDGVKILARGTELTLNLCLLIRRRFPVAPQGFRILVNRPSAATVL